MILVFQEIARQERHVKAILARFKVSRAASFAARHDADLLAQVVVADKYTHERMACFMESEQPLLLVGDQHGRARLAENDAFKRRF